MRCSTCGTELPGGTKFCPNCGSQIFPNKPKKKSPLKIILIVIGVIFLLDIIYYAGKPSKAKASNQTTSAPTKEAAAETAKQSSKAAATTEAKAKEDQQLYKISYQNMDIRKDSIGNMRCNAIVEVENTGSDNIYISGSNQFDITGEDGKIAASITFLSADPKVVKPNEKGYIYTNMGAELNSDIDANKKYTLIPKLDIKKAKIDCIRYDIKDDKMTQGSTGPDIVGSLTNNTDKEDKMVWVSYILYDDKGTPLQAGGTNVMNLPAGDTKGFEEKIFLNESIDKGSVKSYKLFAEPSSQMQF